MCATLPITNGEIRPSLKKTTGSAGQRFAFIEEQGRKEEHGGPAACAEEPPRPVGPGLLSAFQGGPPAAAEAAGPQGGAAGRVSLLEMEEPLSVHGALSAYRDLGPDLCSNLARDAQQHP